MDATCFQEFMNDQIKEIRSLGMDSTQTLCWITNNSELFRVHWESDHS